MLYLVALFLPDSSVSSGLNKDDYPAFDGLHVPTISDVRRIPLPPELVEQFGRILLLNFAYVRCIEMAGEEKHTFWPISF